MAKSAIDSDALTIYRGDSKAGILSRTENGCAFQYTAEFLQNPRFDGLSYGMPKSRSPIVIHGTNLHPFFAGLLPEGLRLKAVIRNSKTSADDLFSLFAAVGAHVVGDVHVNNANPREPYAAPKLKEIDFYEYFRTLIRRDSYSLGDESIAGVQEKISSAMISFPLNIAKAEKAYILKLNPEDIPSLVQNEFHCMTLARRCDIETAKVKIVKDGNGNEGLLVERFDRIWDPDTKSFRMVHQEDACQFLNRYPADKYKLSFAEVTKGLQEFATAKQAATLKLLRVFCFSYLIGNGDLHAKNISLLSRPEQTAGIDIAPAYDLLTTYVYSDKQMALMFDGKKDNINRKKVVEFGVRFGLPEKATIAMLDRLLAKLEINKHLLEDIPIEKKKLNGLFKLIDQRMSDLSKL